ncbi:MAG: hypothetical protein KDA24_20445 [Deltaproteobacteria bacterium]|nr:hypothetical protein [Deltaproteobacteria bacterium]
MRALQSVSIMALLVAGCGPAGPVDTDGDGLLDTYELEIGTNPEDADSDGDGHADNEEIYDFTDPLDEDSRPYTGGWKRMPVPDDIGEEGREVGKVMENFLLGDQFGEEVELHRFYGNVILVESAAEW